MELKRIARMECSGRECPSVYATDRGTYVVQGWIIGDRDLTALELPAGEAAIEIPQELLDQLRG